MAIIIFPPKKGRGNYQNTDAVKYVINYIFKSKKTPNAIVGALGADYINKKLIIKQFLTIQKYYRNCKGKRIIHFIVSFSKEESIKLTLKDYLHIGYSVSEFFDKKDFQVVFALHENTQTYHIHFAVNTVNYSTGKKYHWQKKDTYEIKKLLVDIF